MIVDTVFFYLIAAWYVIEAISAVKNSKEKKHD